MSRNFGKLLGVVIKFTIIFCIIGKIVLDFIFKDIESQGFLLWFIILLKFVNRLRYLEVDLGIAPNAFFENLGDAMFFLPTDKEFLRDNTYGVGSRFYAYEIPSIPLLSMSFLSVLYPLLFALKVALGFLFPILVKPAIKKDYIEKKDANAGYCAALFSYFFLKVYFVIFIMGAADITFYGLRAIFKFRIASFTAINLAAYIHAVVLLLIVSVDTQWVLYSIFRLNDSFLIYKIWRGCYIFTQPPEEDQESEYGSGYSSSIKANEDLDADSGYDSFCRVWRDIIGALFLMGDAPYQFDDGMINFPILSYSETIVTFSRIVLFNVALVTLNGNVIVCLILLAILEILRAVLLTLKAIIVANTAIVERIRLIFSAFEAFGFTFFFGLAFYCWMAHSDREEANTIPFLVQLLIMVSVVFILFAGIAQLVVSIIAFIRKIVFVRELQGGHFDTRKDPINQAFDGMFYSEAREESEEQSLGASKNNSQSYGSSVPISSGQYDQFDMGSRLDHQEFDIKEERSV